MSFSLPQVRGRGTTCGLPNTTNPTNHAPGQRSIDAEAALHPARAIREARPLEYPFPTPPPPGSALELAPGLRWIRMPLPFALDHVNLWLLGDGDAVTLVDCGYGNAPTRAWWESLFATALAGRTLSRIIVTHCHPDHVGNAAWLAARSGAPVVMTHAEFLTAHALHGGHSGHGHDAIVALLARHGLAGDALAALASRGNPYHRGVPDVPETYVRVREGQASTAGGHSWRVIEGHGHSPEHASLYSEAAGVLVSGDMLLPKISTFISIWTIEPDADPLAHFLDSLAPFAALPEQTLVLPSHGLPFRGIAQRVAELRAHHAARLDELAAAAGAAARPVCAAELLPVLFQRELDAQQLFFAMCEAIAHLNHLWHAGRLTRKIGAGGAIHFEHSTRCD